MISSGVLLALLAAPLTQGIQTRPLAPPRFQFTQDQAVLHAADSPSPPVSNTLESGGILRTYYLQVPNDYEEGSSKQWPLIVDFHGRNGSSLEQWNNSQYFLNPQGKEYFVIYPLGCLGAGSNGGPPETAWEGAPYADTSCNDLLFTSDLVSHVQGNYNINSSRIYASGKSNGGGFVDTLACSTTGDIFAAFAMSSAALYTDTFIDPEDCVGKRPRRILEAHGTADNVIPINGRKDFSTPNIARWFSRWAERNDCDPDEDRIITFPTWGMNTTYSCNGLQSFSQQYRVNDLGHCWPSMVDNTDSAKSNTLCSVHTLDFTSAVMGFFDMAQ